MKVLLSLDDRLVKRIDRAADELGLTRSAYIARLATHELDSTPGPGATPTARGAVERLRRLFADNPAGDLESTAALRAARDARSKRK